MGIVVSLVEVRIVEMEAVIEMAEQIRQEMEREMMMLVVHLNSELRHVV